MTLIAPLAQSVRSHLKACTHPGLLLDKFVESYDPSAQVAQKWQESVQKPTASKVVALSQQAPASFDFESLGKRWNTLLNALGAITFGCTTIGPLTLHLSRASALENAGICLHPLYGFAYLPGSGLKGMARAYAETIWLPAQPDQRQGWRQIEDVFGWVPNPDRNEQIKDPDHPAAIRRATDDDPDSPRIRASSGAIIFHDAWPTAWPPLIVDIVNNHHPDYYQNDDNDHAPGDWENPVPVYFLAVKPGTTFTFPLSKRRPDVPDDLLALAQQWLLGGLCHLGAGAKTNAGYGAFKPGNNTDTGLIASVSRSWQAATTGSNPNRAVFETTLELVTPAFLAGADQYCPADAEGCDRRPAEAGAGKPAQHHRLAAAEGCDLRPATLRGHLRWWWRTMHAGFLDVRTLRALEAAIWGDTRAGGAVRIELTPKNKQEAPKCYSHPEDRNSGTRYLAYGMDERNKGQRRRRYHLNPPASWELRLIARPTEFFANREDLGDPDKARNGHRLPETQVLDQAKAALWLLCNYGGVGSKARKGFGSLGAGDLDGFNLDRCRTIGSELRQRCSIDRDFSLDRAESPSISDPDLQIIEISVGTVSSGEVIEQIGGTYSAVASRFKHNVDQQGVERSPNKAAWGLPRKIHGPKEDGPLKDQKPDTWQKPEWLDFPKRPNNITKKNARHASPIHIHVAKNPAGGFVVRVLALPAKYLPSRSECVRMLKVFVNTFREFGTLSLQRLAGNRSTTALSSSVRRDAHVKRPSGTPVRVKIVERRPKGYDVQEEGRSQGTLTVGTPPTPLPKVGDEVDVVVHNDDPKNPQYRWPERDTKSKQRHKSSPPGGPRPSQRR
jgi:CRISPR-associated protein Cmr6